MRRVASIVLGGGQGTRLFPLTLTRCKPAITFGGRYRLVDVPVSNSINSGIHKIFVVTQFLSTSLHQHISSTYQFDKFSGGFIELLAAEQKPSHSSWFQGTADAVRQNMDYFIEVPADYFLILAGDQLYNIDFRQMLAHARQSDADLTIACLPVGEKDASRMGLLKRSETGAVIDFIEKPSDPALLDRFSVGSDATGQRSFLGSMGIYLFKRQALIKLLRQDLREDFGKHLIPTKIAEGSVTPFVYDGYWEDIGTIEAFYKANMNLTEDNPSFNCYDENNTVFTSSYNLPGPKIRDCRITQSIICEGSVIDAHSVQRSIVGTRSSIGHGTVIEDSYLMGNDYLHPPVAESSRFPHAFGIGQDCLIQRAIIDKHVLIGDAVQLINKKQLAHYNGDNIYIRDGVIIVTRGATIPSGFVL
jgi:glucose-1-phosphate adenylyltransferase